MRLNYRRTLLLSSAFFGVQALFAIYNAYLPIFLQSGRVDFTVPSTVQRGFGFSTTITGFIMTLDNLAAILLLPYIGVLSDATTSGLGKRKPYLLVGAPVTALAFAALPLLAGRSLWRFMLVVVVLILAVNIIRTPLVALMPDITPSPLRAQANGIINLMGGLGALVAFLVGGTLYRQSPGMPFFFGAVLLLAGCLVIVIWLPVPVEPGAGTRTFWSTLRALPWNQRERVFDDLRILQHDRDRSLLYLLGTICCAFLAFSALTVFFTSFAVVTLRVGRGQEAHLLTFFALAIVVFALPAGFLSARIGRKRTMLLGMLIFTVTMTSMVLFINLMVIRGLLLIGGGGWALIVVNALPMVLDSAPPGRGERIGTYTGLYFLATQAAEVIGPVLVGGFLDLSLIRFRGHLE